MFRTLAPMTHDVLARYAPSVFATTQHAKTSTKYAFIPTISIVKGLEGAGWGIFGAQEQKIRTQERFGFQKHVLRFRRLDNSSALNIGDSIPELVLTNSHDGSSAYETMLGLFRKVCSNGLHVPNGTIQSVKIRHSGKASDEVIEGSFRLLNETPKLLDTVQSMQKTILDTNEQLIFASIATKIRYGQSHTPINSSHLLNARRVEDRGSDLWTTLNRVQENLMRGGIRGTNANQKRTTTREIKGIDTTAQLNKNLWTIATELQKFKNGEINHVGPLNTAP